MEGFTSDTIPIKDADNDKPLIVLQAKYCLPACRSFPLLVIASPGSAMVSRLSFFINVFAAVRLRLSTNANEFCILS